MRRFTLSYQTDDEHEVRSIPFIGPDPSGAFSIAEREGIGCHAIVREGDAVLGHIERLQSGAWRLTSA